MSWLDRITDFLSTSGPRGGLLLVFPEYRPDLAKAVAHQLGLRFCDFRDEEMSKLGIEAGSMPLESLNDKISLLSREEGVLLFNAEALLATKSSEERSAWMRELVGHDWPNPVLVPITLFAAEAGGSTARVLCFDADELPEQGVISRLMH